MRLDTHHAPAWLRWAARCALLGLLVLAIWILAKNGATWLLQIRSFSWVIQWPLLVVAVCITSTAYCLTPTGWVWLCRAAGSAVPASELRSAWFVSQLGRYMPGKVWLFAGRAGYLKAQGMSVLRATALPFIEFIYTAAAAGTAATLLALLSRNFSYGDSTLRGAVIAAGVCMTAVPLLSPILRLLYRLRYHEEPGSLPLPSFGGMMRTVFMFTFLWGMRGFALFLWLKGFGLQSPDLATCMAAAPLSWLAGYIVFLVPGGIGVREAAVVALAAPVGQTGPALAVVAGERIVLGILEVGFALGSAGVNRGILPGRRGKR
jgi:glycosyltransferase 2 family protein